MRSFGIVLLLLAVALTAPFAGRRSAVAQATTCRDEPATIVASGSGTVYGGSGQDQIYSSESAAVYGESGNDVMFDGLSAIVSGGSGDDLLDAFASGRCDGGSGADTIILHGVGCTTIVSVP